MENEDIKKEVDKLRSTISEAGLRLEEVIKSCRHDEYKIDFHYDVHGFKSLRRICKYCGGTAGYPTEDELKQSGFS